LYLFANVPVFSWFAGSSLSKSEHTVIDLGHGGAPRLVSFYFLDLFSPLTGSWVPIRSRLPVSVGERSGEAVVEERTIIKSSI
jgi:hypothetical protein